MCDLQLLPGATARVPHSHLPLSSSALGFPSGSEAVKRTDKSQGH